MGDLQLELSKTNRIGDTKDNLSCSQTSLSTGVSVVWDPSHRLHPAVSTSAKCWISQRNNYTF